MASSDLRHQAQRRLFHRMMTHSLFRSIISRLGIELSGGWWRGSEELIFRALRACADCPRKPACRAWLDQAQGHDQYPPFCSIGPIIEACRIMAPRAMPLVADASPDSGQIDADLAEMLGDPVIQQVMEADKIDVDRLRLLLAGVARSRTRPN
jgi:hypothetical protein